MLPSFNLVIEMLLVSSTVDRSKGLAWLLFQSRNRDAFGFKNLN